MTTPTEACPRCGKATIEVKDWGKAGALYVHSRTVENGMPVQDACRVAVGAPGMDDVEGLALEIAATEGISLEHALEAARSQLSGLLAYAEAWENWVAAWHDPRVGRAVYA